jgi:hypothetical protein
VKLNLSVVTAIFFRNLFLIIFIDQQQLGNVSFFNYDQDKICYFIWLDFDVVMKFEIPKKRKKKPENNGVRGFGPYLVEHYLVALSISTYFSVLNF